MKKMKTSRICTASCHERENPFTHRFCSFDCIYSSSFLLQNRAAARLVAGRYVRTKLSFSCMCRNFFLFCITPPYLAVPSTSTRHEPQRSFALPHDPTPPRSQCATTYIYAVVLVSVRQHSVLFVISSFRTYTRFDCFIKISPSQYPPVHCSYVPRLSSLYRSLTRVDIRSNFPRQMWAGLSCVLCRVPQIKKDDCISVCSPGRQGDLPPL